MFTFGIFTTHLPYIALVVFYAFFWIIGINKTSSEDIQFDGIKVSLESPLDEGIGETFKEYLNDSQNFCYPDFSPPGSKKDFTVRKKLKYKGFHPDKYRQYCFYTALFSRPPPFLS